VFGVLFLSWCVSEMLFSVGVCVCDLLIFLQEAVEALGKEASAALAKLAKLSVDIDALDFDGVDLEARYNIYIYIHTHTHTHTHIYIYIFIYIYIYIYTYIYSSRS